MFSTMFSVQPIVCSVQGAVYNLQGAACILRAELTTDQLTLQGGMKEGGGRMVGGREGVKDEG